MRENLSKRGEVQQLGAKQVRGESMRETARKGKELALTWSKNKRQDSKTRCERETTNSLRMITPDKDLRQKKM